jgi:hypothetical protein
MERMNVSLPMGTWYKPPHGPLMGVSFYLLEKVAENGEIFAFTWWISQAEICALSKHLGILRVELGLGYYLSKRAN